MTVGKSIFRNSLLLKVTTIGALILILQFPIAQISTLIRSRLTTKIDAERDIIRTAGVSQTIGGVIIGVPLEIHWKDDKGIEHNDTNIAYILPDLLSIKGEAITEKRYRGIFEVATYVTKLTLDGTFTPALPRNADVKPTDIKWNEAFIALGLTDPKTIQERVILQWNEQQIPFEGGFPSYLSFIKSGIHAKMPLQETQQESQMSAPQKFSFSLTIGGSGSLGFIPSALDTRVQIASGWKDPSFNGAYLPVERSVASNGFNAEWRVSHFGLPYPQRWLNTPVKADKMQETYFGVHFLTPVDTHRMTERAIKYEVLFIFLTFLCFYMFELFCGLRIHPIQYLLIGGALCLFYLLLLSLSEQTGFGIAYVGASIVAVALITSYSRSVLGHSKRSYLISSVMSSLYLFLYVLLSEQDYALLIGSLGLTVVLALIMYITRRINWYEVGDKPTNDSATSTLV